VKRSGDGEIVVGQQYQNHNPRPGPVYAGGGYAPVTEALDNESNLRKLLSKYPDLVNDVTTGGAQPLHMCGMSQAKSQTTAAVIEHGGDIEAIDTYGMTPLHRMASNNLPVGARALLEAGADPDNRGMISQSPAQVAQGSAAMSVLKVLAEYKQRKNVPMTHIIVESAGESAVDGKYLAKKAKEIPTSFGTVCEQNNWNTNDMWNKLNGGNDWFKHEDQTNDSYVYFNKSDGKWWIDGPDGLGRYIYGDGAVPHAVPSYGWTSLQGETGRMPQVRTYRAVSGNSSNSEL